MNPQESKLPTVGRAVMNSSRAVQAKPLKAPPSGSTSKLGDLLSGSKETRLAVAVVITAFILVALVMFNILFKSSLVRGIVSNPQDLAANVAVSAPSNAVANSPDLVAAGAVKPDALKPVPMNQTPVSELNLNMVDQFVGTGPSSTIVFRDGSTMVLDAYTLEQLPPEIRLRVTYTQGPQGSQPPAEIRRSPRSANAR